VGFKVGLLGLGTVGTGTAEILLNPDRRHSLLNEIEIARVGVRSPSKPRKVKFAEDVLTTDLEVIVNDPEIDIVVELLGGLEPARSLILQAIANGKHIVTANKAVVSRYGDEIYTAANQGGVYVLIEAAVAGGIPIIKPLKEALGVNRLQSVIGIINGTTNYILTRMSAEGASFDEVLAQAQALGYAEADPTADVDGLDAADKIAIIASIAFGGRIRLDEIHCEGIRQVSNVDITYAERLGFVIKLIAIAKRISPDTDALEVSVHPALLPKNHPLASINGVYNAVLVEGDPIGQVMFFGRGAGAGPTASAVVSDLLNLVGLLQYGGSSETLHPLLSCSHQDYCDITPIEETQSRFYARFLCRDQPGVIGQLGTCFGKHHVSLESVVQIGFQNDLAEIVVVTHDVNEGNFRKALAEVETLTAIEKVPSLLRVL
jgi:homoserine dehydrogenase